jgi:PKD repeat protein
LDRSTDTVDEGLDLDNFFDDDNGTANLTYTVELNTSPAIGASITGNILTLSYPSTPEVSNITIRATDADDNFVEQTFEVTIVVNASTNEAPVAVVSATPISGNAPLEVTFTGSNSTDDVGVVSYLWDFKDGSPISTEMDLSYIFNDAGIYEISLTVADAEGLDNTNTVTVTVGEERVVDNDIRAILFVNPAKEVAQVQIIDMGRGNRTVAKVHLHDSSGRLLGLYYPYEIFRHGLYEIPISTLSNGSLYFIGFEMSRGDRIVLKLVVKN